MDDSEKIINALAIIHQENVLIMQGILRFACYPQDFQEASKEIEDSWNKAFNAE
jgi:hypothetical protein